MWLVMLACHAMPPTPPAAVAPPDLFAAERARMVQQDLVARRIVDPRVLTAMRAVPRHLFVPAEIRDHAYADHPLPIGHEQTISQPYIVARMTEALGVSAGEKVLEIGTGSGYQAAVLAEMGAKVWSIEILPPIAELGRSNLAAAGYGDKVVLRVGDGYRGWPEVAPFDAILVTAAPDHVPQPLVDQLAIGGVLVLPVGSDVQELLRITRTGADVWSREPLDPVRFVPMTGEAEAR
jgi:protein-L-isoaspartate(D-aspartate) O-methyltransferase